MEFLSLSKSFIFKRISILMVLMLVINVSMRKQAIKTGISSVSAQSNPLIMSDDFDEFPDEETNSEIVSDLKSFQSNLTPTTEKPKNVESNSDISFEGGGEEAEENLGNETANEDDENDEDEEDDDNENNQDNEESIDQSLEDLNENNIDSSKVTKSSVYLESLDHKNIPILIEVINDTTNSEILLNKDKNNFSNLVFWTPGAPRLFASYDFVRNNTNYVKKQVLLGEDAFAFDVIILTPVQRQNLADELSQKLEQSFGVKYQLLASQVQPLITLADLECSIEISENDEDENIGKTIRSSKAQIEDMLLRIEFDLKVYDEDRQIFVDMLFENLPVPVQCVYFLNATQIGKENNEKAFSFTVYLNENLNQEQTSSRFGQLEKQLDTITNENVKTLQEVQSRLVQNGMMVLIKPQLDNFDKNGKGINKFAGWFVCDGRNGAPNLSHLNQDGLVYIIYLGIDF
jgi:hypothetical protein